MLLVFEGVYYGFDPNVRMPGKGKQVVKRLMSSVKRVDDVLRNHKAAPILMSGLIRLVFFYIGTGYVYKIKGNFGGCSQVEVSIKVSPRGKKE